ncbi:MAG: AI-2E family transporter [Halorientalis sp.]
MDSSKGLLLALVVVLLAVSVAFLVPYLQFVLLAVLLAYLLAPLQRRLRRRLGPQLAAGSLVVATTVTLLIPLVVVGRVVVREGLTLYVAIRRGAISLTQAERAIERSLGYRVDLGGLVRTAARTGGPDAFGSLLGAFGVLTHLLVGLGLTVFLLYYFLKDGPAFGRWLRRTLPLAPTVQDDLYAQFDAIMWAVLVGHVFVAVVQGVLAGVALVAVGIPNALFWTAVMVVLALLPIVGSFLVWGPAVGYLVLVGETVPGLVLLVWGTVVVSLADNYLRPIVVDRYAQVNPAVIVLGLVGGLTVMGIMGLFFGPIVIGALRATLDVFRQEYVHPTEA